MEDFAKLIKCIENFTLCELSKEYNEHESFPEFQLRNGQLERNFSELINLLENQDMANNTELVSDTLCHLLIFYLEMQTTGPWNTDDTKASERSKKLNHIFFNKYNVNLSKILESDQFEPQIIFDKCIKALHKKMTADRYKKHPSCIDVYCLLVKHVKNYKVKINPVQVLPVALLLIDDYINTNKIKGLASCRIILQCLTTEDIFDSNYHEVVYISLKKNNSQKDIEVTEALFVCYVEFLKIMPPDVKKNKLDDMYSSIIDQLYTETNLNRKMLCFKFVTKIIELHGIHCVKNKLFKDIIHDNLDNCSSESVSEILLHPVLECLQMWIRYCWCTWLLSEGYKILSMLFKMLYLTNDEITRLKIQNIILTLIKLCDNEERMDILENLQVPLNCSNKDFLNSLEEIKREISNYYLL